VLYDEGVQIWVDAEKPTDEETKQLLEGVFNFHPLAIEDCIAVSERPKVDDYENYIFMVIHGVDYRHDSHEFRTTELNLFIGKNFLVTAHSDPMKSVSTTIERVIKNAPLIARAPDRLTYNLLDALLENYQPALDELSSEIADLEGKMVSDPSVDVISSMLKLKTEVSRLRQIIAPQREVIARMTYYGMNIRHMPNTEWPSWQIAYAIILGGTGTWAVLLYLYPKKKGLVLIRVTVL
jgi:magnesium transporter